MADLRIARAAGQMKKTNLDLGWNSQGMYRDQVALGDGTLWMESPEYLALWNTLGGVDLRYGGDPSDDSYWGGGSAAGIYADGHGYSPLNLDAGLIQSQSRNYHEQLALHLKKTTQKSLTLCLSRRRPISDVMAYLAWLDSNYGIQVKRIEGGNETYLNQYSLDPEAITTVAELKAWFDPQIAAIKAVYPGIKFGVPCNRPGDTNIKAAQWETDMQAQLTAGWDEVDAVIIHPYFWMLDSFYATPLPGAIDWSLAAPHYLDNHQYEFLNDGINLGADLKVTSHVDTFWGYGKEIWATEWGFQNIAQLAKSQHEYTHCGAMFIVERILAYLRLNHEQEDQITLANYQTSIGLDSGTFNGIGGFAMNLAADKNSYSLANSSQAFEIFKPLTRDARYVPLTHDGPAGMILGAFMTKMHFVLVYVNKTGKEFRVTAPDDFPGDWRHRRYQIDKDGPWAATDIQYNTTRIHNSGRKIHPYSFGRFICNRSRQPFG